ncbi:MAG: hypothetical protein KBT19_01685 [Lachnospiraceae bacterium]|nr:hypothetical protein [Candidatus Colinaster equi]
MDEEQRYFKKALHNFTYDVACGDAIRHLYDLGYSPEKIRDRLDYKTTIENITKTIEEYEKNKQSALDGKPQYEYVREEDEYGHTSFRRVPKG